MNLEGIETPVDTFSTEVLRADTPDEEVQQVQGRTWRMQAGPRRIYTSVYRYPRARSQ